ncbi:MAG: ShlB/FhaC/HecB family hemolysin secretion/activation protein [Coleofasciculaceae cyanobacterium]
MAAPVTAQTLPNPVLPPELPPVETEPLPPLEELLPPQEVPSNREQPSLEQVPGAITVQQFEVIGSTVFSAEQLAEVLKPFTGRPLSFAELLQAQQAITQLYFEQGYITSGAVIPPQALQDGVVRIEVVEGEVEEIKIGGLERLRTGYVRSRLSAATSPPLNRERLLNALQLLQLDPLIETFSAELSAGSRPGLSILEAQVQEADAFEAQLSIDNRRSPIVGSVRRQIQLTHGNLLGFGDRVDIRYIDTDGSNALDNLSYYLPVNPQYGTLHFFYSQATSDIIEEPFDRLNIESKSRSYKLSYRQPIEQTATEEFVLGLTASRQEVETTLSVNGIDDIRGFPLSPGADDNGETKISALRFFQEYTKRSEQEVLALRSEFSLGIDAINSTINDNKPDSEFLTWRGQAQYLRLLSPETILLLRADLQLADQPLVPLEQFSAGGQLSVRGYRQDVIIADNGFFASAELRVPILTIPEWDTVLQITPFFDFGTVWNNSESETNLETTTISSVGLGLRLPIGDNFTARLDWGIPLVDIESRKDTLQENGIYFSIQYQPF